MILTCHALRMSGTIRRTPYAGAEMVKPLHLNFMEILKEVSARVIKSFKSVSHNGNVSSLVELHNGTRSRTANRTFKAFSECSV